LTHEETSCEVCDETFSYHTERDEGRFCSQECYRDWLHNEHLTGDDSPLANQVTRECDECGQEFKRQQSRVEQNKRDYCSRECYHANHSGENAPNWKGGGVSYYGETWLPQRRKALQRDKYECQNCGLTREQHYDEYGADLEVHHIQPIRTFEDTSEANQLSNLVTLCTECHTEHEHSDEIKLTV
jgi:5-methylcytosine-specific restriction endonuclease McrA